jgi:hypothetical protein
MWREKEEARAEAQAGLALDPKFTIASYRAGAKSDNPTYLARLEPICEGLRRAGLDSDDCSDIKQIETPSLATNRTAT